MATTTIDHEEIRQWAEGKGGKPAAVDRTHSEEDVGIIRLMFPDSKLSEHDHLLEISWDEFFEKFEESHLALIYEEDTLFSKLVKRDHADHGKPAPQHTKPPAHGKSAEPAKTSGGDDDLKAREYRDADGTVHHHTRAAMNKEAGKH